MSAYRKNMQSFCLKPGKETSMKQHKFWAWAAVISMIMVMITGYKHK